MPKVNALLITMMTNDSNSSIFEHETNGYTVSLSTILRWLTTYKDVSLKSPISMFCNANVVLPY